MSDYNENPARPVSLFTIVCLFVLFAAFLLLVRYFYHPNTTLPNQTAAEKLPKEQEWRASTESRRVALTEMRKEQDAKAQAYGWVDQKAGIVQLPIERAMELTVQHYGKK